MDKENKGLQGVFLGIDEITAEQMTYIKKFADIEERAKAITTEMYGCVACSHNNECKFGKGNYNPSALRCPAEDFYDGYTKCSERERKEFCTKLKSVLNSLMVDTHDKAEIIKQMENY